MLRNIRIKELIPPEVWEAEGERGIVHVDVDLRICLDHIWEFFQPHKMVINNWDTGGPYKYRCYRPVWCTVGAPLSAHKKDPCIACDFHIDGVDSEEVRKAIIQNQGEFPFIKRMEDGVNWVHIDGIWHRGSKGIYLFKAKEKK